MGCWPAYWTDCNYDRDHGHHVQCLAVDMDSSVILEAHGVPHGECRTKVGRLFSFAQNRVTFSLLNSFLSSQDLLDIDLCVFEGLWGK